MFVEVIKNRNSPPCVLVRENYRDQGKVRHRTIANISKLPADAIAALRAALKGAGSGSPAPSFDITRSVPHGHVQAVITVIKRLGLHKLIATKHSPERDLVIAMIAGRILDPCSKLATTRLLNASTASSTLAQECGLEAQVHENDLYAAMDWLLPRQARIEAKLAARHLEGGSMVLYDLSSSYFEGCCCPLGKRGYSRDGKRGKLQIVCGLLCDKHGRPLAVEVFEGNTADPSTLGAQIDKLRHRFQLERVILVGDRGMLTDARIREELRPVESLGWISALCAPQIKALAEQGAIQMELFDERNLAEIQSPDFPDERLVVCRNPTLGRSRAHKREELLAATEVELAKISAAVLRARAPLRGKAKIGLRVGKVLGKYKMAKHFKITISKARFKWQRDETSIAKEAAMDGVYVIRANLRGAQLSASELVESYKDLSLVENAFRSLKTVDLHVRPIHHYSEQRVRSHVFLCVLAYYVEWHMREALKPLLFAEDDPQTAKDQRPDVVSPKKPSPSAKAKTRTKMTPEGWPVHSFQTLLAHLATITRNTIVADKKLGAGWDQDTTPTEYQAHVLKLLATHPMP